MTTDWQEHPLPLPPGVVRGWVAKRNGFIYCAIYQRPTKAFSLAYKRKGEQRPVVEFHVTFMLAQQRAIDLLNSGILKEMRHGQETRKQA